MFILYNQLVFSWGLVQPTLKHQTFFGGTILYQWMFIQRILDFSQQLGESVDWSLKNGGWFWEAKFLPAVFPME